MYFHWSNILHLKIISIPVIMHKQQYTVALFYYIAIFINDKKKKKNYSIWIKST